MKRLLVAVIAVLLVGILAALMPEGKESAETVAGPVAWWGLLFPRITETVSSDGERDSGRIRFLAWEWLSGFFRRN